MSDKQKKFRALVVKEMYETEKDYTSALEFTVAVNESLLVIAFWV